MKEDCKKEPRFPNGWVIKTYRHMNIPRSDFDDTEKLFKDFYSLSEKEHQYRDISCGNYDRLQIVPADSFSDFSNESSRAFNWFGLSQSILVFPLEKETKKRCFLWGSDEKGRKRIMLSDHTGSIRPPEGFFAVSFCFVSDEARNRIGSYTDLMDHCNKSIRELVDAYNEALGRSSDEDQKKHGAITAEVFGSLSSAELIVLWSAKQYSDLLYLMDCIRDFCIEDNGKEYSLLRTTFTVISFPDITSEDGVEDASLSDILGDADIQFVMQDGIGEKDISEFEKFVFRCLINSGKLIGEDGTEKISFSLKRCAGEYDLNGHIESRYVPRLFGNPQRWHAEDWHFDPSDEDQFFCSVHHPVYNHYVLYSFTRLDYTEKDLPAFTVAVSDEESKKWAEAKNRISRKDIHAVSDNLIALNIKRSELLRDIQDYHKSQYQELTDNIRERIPVTSNLVTELNQLFSDYVQCCSSSADYLWIEDYNELFLQVMERIKRSIFAVDVWKEYDRYTGEWRPGKDSNGRRWKDARERIKNISDLLGALHQQTSHISVSNKLFFREQEIHFGYTAQHDLVIHAYYDLIKRLIQYIYSYTDNRTQSLLYPLVNFSLENWITSNIFTEESAEDFLRETKEPKLFPRIMVINIPQDGMDNLMHYLPMLIHEVYHYAAPKDRGRRNRILAEIMSFQVLRKSIFEEFRKAAGKHCDKDDEETLHLMQETFQEMLDPVLREEIRKAGGAIFAGIKAGFFDEEPDLTPDGLNDLLILRSWFTLWMENWLHDTAHRDKDKWSDELDQPVYYNYSDLYHTVFKALKEALEKETKENRTTRYLETVGELCADVTAALDWLAMPDDSARTDTNVFFDSVTRTAWAYIANKDTWSALLKQLDEIFPDMAMVELTEMPAAGYMLQVALDLDKQLYPGDGFGIDQIRFGSLLTHLLRKEAKAAADEGEGETFKKALQDFRKMYISAYAVAARGAGGIDAGAELRADKWVEVYRGIFDARYTNEGEISVGSISCWLDELMNEMKDCLTLKEEDIRKEQKELFIEPYRAYLELLNKLDILNKEDLENRQVELFSLSIKMIQKFQKCLTIKSMNEAFLSHRSADGAAIPDPDISSWKYLLKPYETMIPNPESYFMAVQHALARLYEYRADDHISETSGMWFRGVQNISFPILPSGFVHFAENADRLQRGFPDTPCSYTRTQLHNYESFRYSAEGSAGGIDPSKYYSTINYLALMQHYSQHTNLVDWSEDYFGSSYFALENEINANDLYEHERTDPKRSSGDKADAVMYILDPVRFNRACEEIEREFPGIADPGTGLHADIPNLSITENRDAYQEYHDIYSSRPARADAIKLERPAKAGKAVTLADILADEDAKKEIVFRLPRAVYTAKLNARIRAQSGLFVAFSLKSMPVIWKDSKIVTNRPNTDLFEYQAIETIQEYYLSRKGKNPFLLKIRIPAEIKEKLGNILYKCGISKEKIYPELQNYRHR